MSLSKDTYAWGAQLYNNGDYDQAAVIFASMGDFSDAREQVKASTYEAARQRLEKGEYEEARSAFFSLKNYRDSRSLTIECDYQIAKALYEAGEYKQALDYFVKAGLREYKDAPAMMNDCRYQFALAKKNEGSYEDAIEAFGLVADYSDSKAQITECYQALGAALEAMKQFAQAYEKYSLAGDKSKMQETAYQEGMAMLSSGEFMDAVNWLEKAEAYSDSMEQILAIGEYYLSTKQYDPAETIFLKVIGLENVDRYLYEIGQYYEQNGEEEKAHAVYHESGDYAFERVYKPFYDEGLKQREEQHWDKAVENFKLARDYKDSETQILITYYAEGEARCAAQDWDGARKVFGLAGTYSDAADQILATYYAEGEAKRAAQDWDGARKAFELAETYSDAADQITETTYQEAQSFYNAGDYKKAYNLFIQLSDYKNVADLLKNDENLVATATAAARETKLASFKKIGNIVSFGTYPQTKKGTDQTPIEWIVLDYDEANHKALLLSRYGLDAMPYNKEYTLITWENCTLRAWLNSEFLNKAFSIAEQSAILITKVDNSASQGYSEWNTDSGNNTQDQFFLLSYAEASRYLDVTTEASNIMISRVAPTAYAHAQDAWTSEKNETADGRSTGCWWLRSLCNIRRSAAVVNAAGFLSIDSIDFDRYLVRPAFWLNLDSDIF